MNIKSDTSVFALCLAVSLALHAAALAWWHVARPVTDTQVAFSVEILPPQPVVAAPVPAAASAPPPPASAFPPRAQTPPASPPRAASAERIPEPPPVPAARADAGDSAAPATPPAERVRSPEKEGAAAPERKAEAGPPSSAAAVTSDAALRNKLEYPLASRQKGEQGTVLVRVLVSRDGTALRVELEKSSGWPNLDEAALRSLRAARFTPARRGDEAIEKEYLFPVAYGLSDARR